MAWWYFYDLPVYRLSEERYYSERDDCIGRAIFQTGSPEEPRLRAREQQNPRANDWNRGHLERSYGGCWRFNEVIGQIRLHFLGSQVRGEYFAVAKQRIVRTRTKTIEYRTWKLAPEVDINSPYRTTEVLDAIRQYIRDCEKELPKRFIDTSMFDAIAPHVDWAAAFRASSR